MSTQLRWATPRALVDIDLPGRSVLTRLLVSGVAVLALHGCLRGGGSLPDGGIGQLDASGETASVQIGVPDPTLAFIPLEEGGEIMLATFGQGGTHAELAVRCIAFGDEAFVDVTLENLESGATVMTPPSSRPPLLLCREGGCDLAPIFVMTGGLADPEDKNGLRIRVTAEARNIEGVAASTSIEAVLRGAPLLTP